MSVSTAPKLVSIGMPVYNGERYLEEAIQSILNQSLTDFELIICDNASNDSTGDICRKYAKLDSRIRYYRSRKNLGAACNFNRAFELSSGKYFKWAAHDDICAPQFIAKCVAAMEADPTIALCHSNIQVIDEIGAVIGAHPHRSERINQFLLHIGSEEPDLRFADMIQFKHPCIDVFGLIRTRILRKTKLIMRFVGSDRLLLAVLSLHGRFHRIPENLFFSRSHDQRSIIIKDRRTLAAWFDTSRRNWVVLPHWMIFVQYCKTAFTSDLSADQKRKCYRHLCRWLATYHKRLIIDIKLALKDLIYIFLFRLGFRVNNSPPTKGEVNRKSTGIG